MISPRKFQVVQWVLLASVMVVAFYFAFVFRHFSNQAASLDNQLLGVWQKLQTAGVVNASAGGVNLAALEDQGRWLESQSQRLKTAAQSLTNRLAFEPAVQEKVRAPFQLFEFQNERQTVIDELKGLSEEKHVAFDPAVISGFPEYSAEQKQPGLLWAQLSLAQHLLETAIRCQVGEIKSLSMNPPRPAGAEESLATSADEVSVNVELTGLSPAVSRFLLCLALRADEAKAVGLTETPGVKPALFIERVLIRKDSGEKPDSVKAELRVSALVFRE